MIRRPRFAPIIANSRRKERASEMAGIEQMIEACGFESVGTCSTERLQVNPEVRSMCSSDRCQNYERSWSCPPACGELADFQALIEGRQTCYVVQTVAHLEDEFDIETMMEAEATHKERMFRLKDLIGAASADAEVFGAGGCTMCSRCTYPDEPCRFPEKMMVSMEAAGLLVSDVCQAADIPYNHGKNTMAYTGCVIV